MKKSLLLFAAILLCVNIAAAQVTVSIPSVTPTSENSAITVPVNVTGFNSIGAISIKITYDPNVLTFTNATNLPTPDFLYNASNGTISLGWASLTAMNLGSGKLIDLNFQYKTGTSNLTFSLADCEIANSAATPLSVTYTNGKVNSPSGGGGSQVASIGGTVWNDINKNGIQDNGEVGIQWVTAELYDCNNAWKAWVSTDVSGNYKFSDLAPGDYYVKIYLIDANKDFSFSPKDAGSNDEKDSDFGSLTDSTGKSDCTTLASGENDLTVDAGIFNGSVVPVINTASIGNLVWNDVNKNGVQDGGETGLANVTVKLIDCGFTVLKTKQTNASGNYSFDSLAAGSYAIEFVAPSGYDFSPKNVGADHAKDSDPDALHGRADCFSLAAAEVNNSIDAGFFVKTIADTSKNSSLGNKVWNDANHNGILDNGETGLAWVTVELYDCNNAWKGYVLTDANGEYLFDSLKAGDYYLKFYLTGANSSFRFTTNNITTLSDTVGKTTCITLAANQNNLTQDVGVSNSVIVPPPPTGTPVLSISKTDGIDVMPDSGSTTTYTITYGNTGTAALLNAAIQDTLPEGVSFIAASGGGIASSGVVTFALGTLNKGANGSVTVQVKVTGFEAEYLNTAYLTGKDSSNIAYAKSDDDLNFGDTTSSGCNSGVESRGDLAELLLKREWKIRNGLTTPVLSKSGANSVNSQLSLQQLVPVEGPYSSHAVETTPFDILGISNAVASYAVDYKLGLSGGDRRVAGIFSTITVAPGIYDHTKVVCDRLAGSAIEEIKLLNINGHQFYAAKLRKSSGRITDYAISFSIYETTSGYYVENKWTYEEYHAPAGASNVYNFQAWAGSYEGAVELVKSILSNVSAAGSVTYMNNSQNAPEVFIKSTRYSHDGNIHLTLVNNGDAKQVSLTSNIRFSQGDELIPTASTVTAVSGESEVVLPLGIISDAQVMLGQTSGFRDQVFVSGGAYTYVTGSGSSIAEFKTNGYAQQNLSSYPEGAIMLSGGAYTAGSLKDWVTVVRALTTNGAAYDLRSYGQLRFEAKGTGTITVILDLTNVNNYNYFAKTITLSSQNQEYVLNFADFKQLYGNEVDFDANKVRAVGFMISSATNPGLSSFNLEVKNIGFYTEGATDVKTDDNSVPSQFNLAQNFPNPFNPSTVIEFSVPNKEMISLKIYNVLGQEVASLVNEELTAGRYSVNFDASLLSSGVYFYSLRGNSVNMTKKMTLTK